MQFSIHIIRTVINTGNDPGDQNKSSTNKHKGKSTIETVHTQLKFQYYIKITDSN